MAFFQILAVDLDGTLAPGGELSPEALAAIDEARRDGLVVVLVSGRIGAELTAEFPQVADHVDAMVLENGAVTVIRERTSPLCEPVDTSLDDALAARGVPFRRGVVLVAVDGRARRDRRRADWDSGIGLPDGPEQGCPDGAAGGRDEGHRSGCIAG